MSSTWLHTTVLLILPLKQLSRCQNRNCISGRESRPQTPYPQSSHTHFDFEQITEFSSYLGMAKNVRFFVSECVAAVATERLDCDVNEIPHKGSSA